MFPRTGHYLINFCFIVRLSNIVLPVLVFFVMHTLNHICVNILLYFDKSQGSNNNNNILDPMEPKWFTMIM